MAARMIPEWRMKALRAALRASVRRLDEAAEENTRLVNELREAIREGRKEDSNGGGMGAA